MGNSCSYLRQSGEAPANTPSNTKSTPNTIGECSNSMSVEQQIERSKVHWSTLAEQSSSGLGEEVQLQRHPTWRSFFNRFCMADEEEGEAKKSNKQEFMELQRHPTWGSFFQTFGYEIENGRHIRQGELVVGKKFAEGGQAELFHAKVTWWYPEDNEMYEKEGVEFVVKVFKKGTFLRDLKSQLPHGLLQFHVEHMEDLESPMPKVTPRYFCKVHRGILLKNGQFAFLMQKEDFDLRSLIERTMESKSDGDYGPFSKDDGEIMMYFIALGVEWLHNRDIIHRDLKASNVLVKEYTSTWPKWLCFVADYECSIGVVGTGYFRAPEILQACKEKTISQKPEVFSRAADIYAYGMTCYEVLTGKLPFEDHPLHDQTSSMIDQVINDDLRPEIPEHVEGWARNLLNSCWQRDLRARQSVGEVLDLLSTNSTSVKRLEEGLKEHFGEDFRYASKHQL
ncbi:hypothetical protein M758_10G082800 [Ceratodon purpureus]|uniref:Protein kinase domain-containing protein n=1 Tax=Ceratodon purpureus TaxID=3225 RepID=A0A8T0GQ95_CERPU|nr:hypothetical protein KC19_10G084200 [Ceratodon purpureus]KAG0603302.1 hypothetical protein M758_10G082800 [Ceratodon purpureus]